LATFFASSTRLDSIIFFVSRRPDNRAALLAVSILPVISAFFESKYFLCVVDAVGRVRGRINSLDQLVGEGIEIGQDRFGVQRSFLSQPAADTQDKSAVREPGAHFEASLHKVVLKRYHLTDRRG